MKACDQVLSTGCLNNNIILTFGLWSTSEKKEIQEAQYGQAFSRFELTKEEAISFWSSLVGVSEYVSTDVEGLFEGGGAAAPTWKKNVLYIYVESHVGMRGPVYDEYKVYFPKKASEAFKIEKNETQSAYEFILLNFCGSIYL